MSEDKIDTHRKGVKFEDMTPNERGILEAARVNGKTILFRSDGFVWAEWNMYAFNKNVSYWLPEWDAQEKSEDTPEQAEDTQEGMVYCKMSNANRDRLGRALADRTPIEYIDPAGHWQDLSTDATRLFKGLAYRIKPKPQLPTGKDCEGLICRDECDHVFEVWKYYDTAKHEPYVDKSGAYHNKATPLTKAELQVYVDRAPEGAK